jgi:hypothetical protein
MKGILRFGGSAPKPPGFTAFFSPEWALFFFAELGGGICCRPVPFRPLQPVARVASLHCPIPSGSGTLSMHEENLLFKMKIANRCRDHGEF